jgi:acetyl esterase/lipase
VATKLIRVYFKFATMVEYRTTKSLDAGADKARFVLIDPAQVDGSGSYYNGVLTSNPTIRPVPVAGLWYQAPPPAGAIPPLVTLHFHGGAFVLGGARPAEGGWGPPVMSKHMDCSVLLPQYRLSSSQDQTSCFPAALQDAVTAYAYLLNTLHVHPENVVLSGDSAGANLVVALLRFLGEEGKALPRAALLWGPWVNPARIPTSVPSGMSSTQRCLSFFRPVPPKSCTTVISSLLGT